MTHLWLLPQMRQPGVTFISGWTERTNNRFLDELPVECQNLSLVACPFLRPLPGLQVPNQEGSVQIRTS